MGTDIHPVVQARRDGVWQFVEIPRDEKYDYLNLLNERWYDLFAILGDVRNGTGFGGVVTGSGFTPISSGRGLPEDFPAVDESCSLLCPKHSGRALPAAGDVEEVEDEDSRWDCRDCYWLGDHSHTWVTVRELIDYDWDAPVAKAGVIEGFDDGRQAGWRDYTYVEWMKEPDFLTAMPKSYAVGISGPNYVDIGEQDFQAILRGNAPRDPNVVYVVAFARQMRVRDIEGMSSFLADEGTLGWLKSLGDPDDVRIVMGFDS